MKGGIAGKESDTYRDLGEGWKLGPFLFSRRVCVTLVLFFPQIFVRIHW